jgi:hypothetical protein
VHVDFPKKPQFMKDQRDFALPIRQEFALKPLQRSTQRPWRLACS